MLKKNKLLGHIPQQMFWHWCSSSKKKRKGEVTKALLYERASINHSIADIILFFPTLWQQHRPILSPFKAISLSFPDWGRLTICVHKNWRRECYDERSLRALSMMRFERAAFPLCSKHLEVNNTQGWEGFIIYLQPRGRAAFYFKLTGSPWGFRILQSTFHKNAASMLCQHTSFTNNWNSRTFSRQKPHDSTKISSFLFSGTYMCEETKVVGFFLEILWVKGNSKYLWIHKFPTAIAIHVLLQFQM